MAQSMMTAEGAHPKVAAIVLNWERAALTIKCVESLLAMRRPGLDVIVVDNGSTDDSMQRINQTFGSHVTLLQSGANLGFAGGCNVGIRHALRQCGSDYIWLINNDAVVEPSALAALLRVTEDNHNVGAVGALIDETGGAPVRKLWGGGIVNLWTGRVHALSVDEGPNRRLDYLSGACVLVRKEVIGDIGLLDEKSFFMYWEDTDWGMRMRRAGWRLAVAEDARINHIGSASAGARSARLDYLFARSAVRFYKRYAPLPALPIMMTTVSRCLKRIATLCPASALAVLRGVRDGLRDQW